MAFHPYLNFNGNCREAFTFYQQLFGGDLQIMAMSEMPSDEPVPPEVADLVMHAALTTPDGGLLMASDAQPEYSGPMQFMYVNWATADVDEAERVWAALSEGGTVEMPLSSTFWSPSFGVCVDRFGTPWMVNAEPPPST
jgi:PhnB protein